jgi:hypothetical protein
MYYVILQDDKRWYHIEVNSYGGITNKKKFFKA